jgi:hypothetical protein
MRDSFLTTAQGTARRVINFVEDALDQRSTMQRRLDESRDGEHFESGSEGGDEGAETPINTTPRAIETNLSEVNISLNTSLNTTPRDALDQLLEGHPSVVNPMRQQSSLSSATPYSSAAASDHQTDKLDQLLENFSSHSEEVTKSPLHPSSSGTLNGLKFGNTKR